LMYRLSENDTWSLHIHHAMFFGFNGSASINGSTKNVHHAAENSVTSGNLNDSFCTLNSVAFVDVFVFPEEHDAHRVFLEVQHHSVVFTGELNQLTSHHCV